MFGVTGVHLSVLVGKYGMTDLKQPISLKWRPVFYLSCFSGVLFGFGVERHW